MYKQKLFTLYFYFFSSFIVIIFEMLSVGLVPLFALSLTDNNEVITKIFSTVGLSDYFNNLNKNRLLFSSQSLCYLHF